jgi:hypothetical protein
MTLWHCYAWESDESPRRDTEARSTPNTPEAAVEWLRRELQARNTYTTQRVVLALSDLREGKAVSITDDLPGGSAHLEIVPVEQGL